LKLTLATPLMKEIAKWHGVGEFLRGKKEKRTWELVYRRVKSARTERALEGHDCRGDQTAMSLASVGHREDLGSKKRRQVR